MSQWRWWKDVLPNWKLADDRRCSNCLKSRMTFCSAHLESLKFLKDVKMVVIAVATVTFQWTHTVHQLSSVSFVFFCGPVGKLIVTPTVDHVFFFPVDCCILLKGNEIKSYVCGTAVGRVLYVSRKIVCQSTMVSLADCKHFSRYTFRFNLFIKKIQTNTTITSIFKFESLHS